MGKKRKKNKKKFNKAHILQASQQIHHTATTANPFAHTAASTATSSVVSSLSPSAVSSSSRADKFEQQFGHVHGDLRFFLLMVVVFAAILTGLYFWNQSSNIILSAGQKLYQILNLQ